MKKIKMMDKKEYEKQIRVAHELIDSLLEDLKNAEVIIIPEILSAVFFKKAGKILLNDCNNKKTDFKKALENHFKRLYFSKSKGKL